MEDIQRALAWLLSTSGPPLAVLGLLGFVFREKWKQLLASSMSEELERLKHELVLKQQENAASLAPQLEKVRHEFQVSLEGYKTSLIAQAEEAKLKADLKKSTAAKFNQIKFDRFVSLEQELTKSAGKLASLASYPLPMRTTENWTEALSAMTTLSAAYEQCEMFLEIQELKVAFAVYKRCGELLAHIGPGNKQVIAADSPENIQFLQMKVAAQNLIRAKISEMAKV